MKRNFVVFMASPLLILCIVGLSDMARANVVVSLSDEVSLPGFSFNYNTSSYAGQTYFNANLSNSDQTTSICVGFAPDLSGGNSNAGWVTVSFAGDMTPAISLPAQSESMSVSRHGISVSSIVGSYSSQDQIGWNYVTQEPVFGDWLSCGYGQVSLMDVTMVNSYANYYEYGSNGVVAEDNSANTAGTSAGATTNWQAVVEWYVQFDNPTSASYASAIGSSVTASPAPEPASLGLLGLGATALLARRRRGSR